jgi:hypothetical protein
VVVRPIPRPDLDLGGLDHPVVTLPEPGDFVLPGDPDSPPVDPFTGDDPVPAADADPADDAAPAVDPDSPADVPVVDEGTPADPEAPAVDEADPTAPVPDEATPSTTVADPVTASPPATDESGTTAASSDAPDRLAFTGSNSLFVLVGAGVLAVGLALWAAAAFQRRRHT